MHTPHTYTHTYANKPTESTAAAEGRPAGSESSMESMSWRRASVYCSRERLRRSAERKMST